MGRERHGERGKERGRETGSGGGRGSWKGGGGRMGVVKCYLINNADPSTLPFLHLRNNPTNIHRPVSTSGPQYDKLYKDINQGPQAPHPHRATRQRHQQGPDHGHVDQSKGKRSGPCFQILVAVESRPERERRLNSPLCVCFFLSASCVLRCRLRPLCGRGGAVNVHVSPRMRDSMRD